MIMWYKPLNAALTIAEVKADSNSPQNFLLDQWRDTKTKSFVAVRARFTTHYDNVRVSTAVVGQCVRTRMSAAMLLLETSTTSAKQATDAEGSGIETHDHDISRCCSR